MECDTTPFVAVDIDGVTVWINQDPAELSALVPISEVGVEVEVEGGTGSETPVEEGQHTTCNNNESRKRDRNGNFSDNTHSNTPIKIEPGAIAHIVSENLILNTASNCCCGRYHLYARCGHLYEDFMYRCGKSTSKGKPKLCKSPAPISILERFQVNQNCDWCNKKREGG